jgi:hypothetical protein
MPYMALCKTEQALSIVALRYLQLVTAIHARILLRRGSSCRQMTEIAAHFTQIRAVTPC